MKNNHTFIQAIKTHWQPVSLLFLALVCLISTYAFNNHMQKEKRMAQSTYEGQAQANLNAARSMTVLNDEYKKYKSYVDAGIVGKAKRLQHFELLRALGNQLAVPSVIFSIDKSTFATADSYYIWDGVVHLQYSLMRLELILDHEGQFQQFMDGLSQYASGVSSVQRCELQRLTDSEVQDKLKEIKASCELHWYTVKDITRDWGVYNIVQN